MVIEQFKRCSGCHKVLRVVPNVTFDRHKKKADGLQPFCKSCDWKTNNLGDQGKRNGWCRLKRVVEAKNPDYLPLWSWESYLEMMKDFKCFYCGSDVVLWSGSGYWVDRIDSGIGYHPGNCVPCCAGCNFLKTNRASQSFRLMLQPLLDSYPFGKIPWSEHQPRVKFVENPYDLSSYAIEDLQLQLQL